MTTLSAFPRLILPDSENPVNVIEIHMIIPLCQCLLAREWTMTQGYEDSDFDDRT